jgi:hypothetical protein
LMEGNEPSTPCFGLSVTFPASAALRGTVERTITIALGV